MGSPVMCMAVLVLFCNGGSPSRAVLLDDLTTTPDHLTPKHDNLPPNLKDLPSRSPLFEYVSRPDSHFKYFQTWQNKSSGVTSYMLNMTSQKWLSESEVDRAIWWHGVFVVVPDTIKHTDTAFMFIANGFYNEWPHLMTSSDSYPNKEAIELARRTGTVTAVLQNVPNQPIRFQDDPLKTRKTEDKIIAWTWRQFLDDPTPDPQTLVLFPMVKAAVRGMDTITNFTTGLDSRLNISKFAVGGSSKRGWITWLTGAVDRRVVAIVPIVFDLLNPVENLHHMYQSLGGWTFALDDYYEVNITRDLPTPRFEKMMRLIDPLEYNDLLTMPKYMIGATGDEFFLIDNTYNFYKNLTGETMLRFISNDGHSLSESRDTLVDGIHGFYQSILQNAKRPQVSWTMDFSDIGGQLTMTFDVKPLKVEVEKATDPTVPRRDFRTFAWFDKIPHYRGFGSSVWFSSPGAKVSDFQHRASFVNPQTGWIAFHIKATFQGPENSVYEVTTENMVIPNTFCFPRCDSPDSCWGTIV